MTKARFQVLFETEIAQVFDTFTQDQLDRYARFSQMSELSREGKITYLARTSLEYTPENRIVETSTKTVAFLREAAAQREVRGGVIAPGMKLLLALCDCLERAVETYKTEEVS